MSISLYAKAAFEEKIPSVWFVPKTVNSGHCGPKGLKAKRINLLSAWRYLYQDILY
jgi:hypothetical protein